MHELAGKDFKSTYGIRKERLLEHYGRLRELGLGPAHECVYMRMVLFLSGFGYGVSYFSLSYSGSEFETVYYPQRGVDDGLGTVARDVLKLLGKKMRSRSISASVKGLKEMGPHTDKLNDAWLRFHFAWLGLDIQDRDCPVRVWKWLDKQGFEPGWLRLSMAAGINGTTVPEGCRFVLKAMHGPCYPFLLHVSQEQEAEVRNLIKNFKRDHTRDEPERHIGSLAEWL